MSTNAIVAITTETGYKAVYVHWDGYDAHVGQTLRDHYTDVMNVWELISNGNISSLGDTIKDSVFYHRDREEELVILECDHETELDNLYGCPEYVYVGEFVDGAVAWKTKSV